MKRKPFLLRLFPLKEKLPRLFRLVTKEARQLLGHSPHENKRIVFIVGCQRSGTTLFTHIFERDLNAKVFGEWSALSSMDRCEGLRLNPIGDVRTLLERSRFPLIVTKPLVESQNVLRLLDEFPNSKAIWLFRSFIDVASSNLVEFGQDNGLSDLQPIVDGDSQNWRSENVSSMTREQVTRHFHPDLTQHDAAALFWYARNRIFVEQELGSHPRVLTIRYEDFVMAPKKWMRAVYSFLDRPYPGDQIVGGVSARSVGKGRDVVLSDDVRDLCSALHSQLIQAASST